MTELFTYCENNYYIHWGVCVTLIVLLLLSWFSNNKKTEGFEVPDLTKIDEVNIRENPQVQLQYNPVPNMIDIVHGTKWYPLSYPRRVNAIMDPITERKVHINMVDNLGNMFTTKKLPNSIEINEPLNRVLCKPPY